MGEDRVRVKPYLHEAIPLVPKPKKGERSIHPTLPVTDDDDREATTIQIQRILARFFKGSRQNTTYIVVCHGNVIRYLVCEALGLPYETWMRIDSRHAAITEFRVYPGGFRALVNYNDTSHLPMSMVST
jgi:broad specificity phosphatase PhoE